MITVAERPVERFEQYHATALTSHGARGVCGERTTGAIGAEDHAVVPHVPFDAREVQRHPAGECHIGLTATQTRDRFMDGHQRRGAGGLYRDRGSRQVEFVGDLGGQEVLFIAGHRLEGSQRLGMLLQQTGEPGEIGSAACEQRDVTVEPSGVVAGVLQRVPGGFVE